MERQPETMIQKSQKSLSKVPFTAENKMGKSTHSPAHFKLNMMNEKFYLLKSQEFINKLEKICFSLGIEFEPIGNLSYTTELLT